MKVVHVSTADWLGGAARAAYRLHAGLRELNASPTAGNPVESTMLVASRCSGDPAVKQFRPEEGTVARVLRGARKWRIQHDLLAATQSRPAGFEPFSMDQSAYTDELLSALPPCDVVNLHWVSEFVDYAHFLPALCAKVPVVWTLHDMNPLTGGCHYDDGCGRYADACGHCPQLGSTKANDLSAKVFARKREIFSRLSHDRLHIVSPSRWLADAARSSPFLGRFDISVIPYGLDTAMFSPIGKKVCRDALRIPHDRKVLLFVAQSSCMRRKGFGQLAEVLGKLKNQNVFLLSVGGGAPEVGGEVCHLHLGNVEHDVVLALAYGAADVFVIPSLQDNLPNTVLESMSCGTPVAGFAVGGIPDMIRPAETGVLAPPGDVEALADAIGKLLSDEPRRRWMSENCRRVAVEEYASAVQAHAYENLYKSL